MIKMRIYNAIRSLQPWAEFGLRGDDLATLAWYDDESVVPRPSDAEILAEADRLDRVEQQTEYQRLRAAEYPPMADYLDAVVKSDQAQIDAYIAACLAVKEKYPKPSE